MNNPIAGVIEHWESVIDDMEATANDYRSAGWTVVELHPGDVTVSREDQPGFDVLVPDNEFEQLEAAVAEGTFDDTQLFRAEADGVTFVLAVTADTDSEVAVCCPVYFDSKDAAEIYGRAEDGLTAEIRTLTDDQRITIDYDNPDPFFSDDVTNT